MLPRSCLRTLGADLDYSGLSATQVGWASLTSRLPMSSAIESTFDSVD